MTPDPMFSLQLVGRIASVGLTLSSLEYLALEREFRAGGVYDGALLSRNLPAGFSGRCFGFLFSYYAFLCGISIRLAAGILILSGAVRGPGEPLLFLVATVTSLGLALRVPFGMEGSGQMMTITCAALTLSGLCPNDTLAQKAALWFLALQACLAYVTAGLAKYNVPAWRNGSFLIHILRTRCYGNRSLSKLLSLSTARVCSWIVIAFECSFPLVLLAGKPWALAFLAAGVAFHAVNAFVLGLNVFFWAFVATYPAIWFCTR
jgi:hypothetical protein